jgi:hypothetical protein
MCVLPSFDEYQRTDDPNFLFDHMIIPRSAAVAHLALHLSLAFLHIIPFLFQALCTVWSVENGHSAQCSEHVCFTRFTKKGLQSKNATASLLIKRN